MLLSPTPPEPNTGPGSPTLSGTFNSNLEDNETDNNTASFTETMTATQTTITSEADTFSETLSESGDFAAGSSSNASTTVNGSDTYIATDSIQDQSGEVAQADEVYTAPVTAYDSYGYAVSSSDSVAGVETATGTDSWTEQSQSGGSLYQAGSFSNDSYSLSSYSLSQSGGDTLTGSSSDSVSGRSKPATLRRR